MGMLIDGVWHPQKNSINFDKKLDEFHHYITSNGESGFKAETGRYHLYISLACPWAHRTLIFRKLKKLENIISLSIVDPIVDENGWEFGDGIDCIADTVNNFKFLHQLYTKAKIDYTGRVSTPVLWDKKTHTIVNNESSEIIRMFNSEFNAFGDQQLDFYPLALTGDIDNINDRIFTAGFADNQQDYDAAFDALFTELDLIEKRLSENRYLVGDKITEADWRLFTTLVRFDAVYYIHFKCSLHRIIDFPNMINYMRELYQYPGVAETVNFDHINRHYYLSHRNINPTGIVPKGPVIDLTLPHNRNE
jgi:putative glutathione S-transferase